MKNRFKRTKVAPGIYRRGDTYEAFANVNGKTYSAGSHPTIKRAKDEQATRKAELLSALQIKPKLSDKTPFRAYAEHWVKTRMAGAKPFKPSMERTVRSHLTTLNAVIGDVKLRDFSPEKLRQIEPSIAPGKSPKYRKNLLQTMVSILEDAFKFGTLKRDVTTFFDYPEVPKAKVSAPPFDQAMRIVGAMRFPFNIAAVLAAMTGMRQGEILALEWTDVEWDALEITVSKARDQATGRSITPKTDAGIRSVTITPLVVAILRAYQIQQRERITGARVRAEAMIARYGSSTHRAAKARRILTSLEGEHWDRYLFPARIVQKWTSADGSTKTRREGRLPVLEARNLVREFHATREATGVRMRWHSFRHVFASNVLASGGPGALNQLARQLGHVDASFTLKQYSHVLEGRAQQLLQPMDALLSTPSDAFDLAQLLAPGGKK